MDFTIRKNNFTSPWLPLMLITIAATIIYSNIYNAPFVFDDLSNIVENKKIRDFSYYSSLEQILKPRNIVYFTFAINYKLFGLNVVGYHIVNVLIHILNGFLVYLLSLTIFKKLKRTSSSPDVTRQDDQYGQAYLMSLFAALIFVTHPMQTQAITYTIQRFTSMAAMFYLAAVFFYLKARLTSQNQKLSTRGKYSFTFPPGLAVRTGYILSGLCGVLALLSKQSAASLPGAVLLIEYLLINRAWAGWKKMIPWFAFSFTLWVIFVFYVLGVFSSEINSGTLSQDISNLARVQVVTVSRWQYLCTQFNVLVIYIRMLFLPINQCLDYLYPYKDGFLDDYTPMAFSFLAGLVAIGMRSIRKRPVITLTVFWFFITLSVESGIIPLYAYFEHRLYLPMFGFAIFVTWFLLHLFPADTTHRRSWVIVIYTIVIISLGAATYHRNGVWQSEIELWSDAVTKSPENYRAHNNLGSTLLRKDKLDEAIVHFKKSLQIKPDYGKAHNNLGVALVRKGKLDDAILHYKEALRIDPDYAEVHSNLGIALVKDGKLDDAIAHYREALRTKPDLDITHKNLGNALLRKDELDEAILHYKEALRINHGNVEASNSLGVALVRVGKLDDAIVHYKKILRTNPRNAETHNTLGNMLLSQNNLDETIFHYNEAIKINPNYAEAHYNLGIALAKVRKFDDAVFHYREAFRIMPDHKKANNNLGNIFSRHGKFDEATLYYREAIRIDPSYAEAHYNLGNVFLQLEKLDDAVFYYKEALRIYPDFKEAQNSLELTLKKIGKNNNSLETITVP